MKIIEKQLDNLIFYPISDKIEQDKIIYFDIETTGLSADTSYLYMIGILIQRNGFPFLIQWLLDSINEEKELLQLFFGVVLQYELLVHYNGQAFDIPYLTKKAKRHHLNAPFESIASLDIYKEIKPFRKLLPLPDLKQRTMEGYLNFHREDPFTGEELIEVYAGYTGYAKIERLRKDGIHQQAEALRHTLLLHNQEDLTGLAICCFMLYCQSILNGSFTAEYKETDPYTETAIFTIIPDKQLTKEQSIYYTDMLFTLYPSAANLLTEKIPALHVNTGVIQLDIPYYNGELKYFYPNYQDYYYLPEEDTAIHKSIGEHVEKQFRQKAKKTNCYQRKTGVFLPQYDDIFTPSFKAAYKDKVTYFELTDNIFNTCSATRYIKSILIQDK